MKPRELGGAIRRAKQCYLWVFVGPMKDEDGDECDDGIYIAVGKPMARQLVEEGKEKNYGHVYAYEEDGELFIGEPIEIDVVVIEGAEAVDEEEGIDEDDAEEEDGEEDTEEDDADEEEEEEEEP